MHLKDMRRINQLLTTIQSDLRVKQQPDGVKELPATVCEALHDFSDGSWLCTHLWLYKHNTWKQSQLRAQGPSNITGIRITSVLELCLRFYGSSQVFLSFLPSEWDVRSLSDRCPCLYLCSFAMRSISMARSAAANQDRTKSALSISHDSALPNLSGQCGAMWLHLSFPARGQ